MSTVGLRTSNVEPRPLSWLRWLDFALLAVALPVFLIADLPIVGYLAAGGAWIAQRAVQLAVQRRVDASEDPRTIVGLSVGSMIARAWMLALAIFGVGLADNDAGLAAAVLVITLFTLYFTVQLILRPLDRMGAR